MRPRTVPVTDRLVGQCEEVVDRAEAVDAAVGDDLGVEVHLRHPGPCLAHRGPVTGQGEDGQPKARSGPGRVVAPTRVGRRSEQRDGARDVAGLRHGMRDERTQHRARVVRHGPLGVVGTGLPTGTRRMRCIAVSSSMPMNRARRCSSSAASRGGGVQAFLGDGSHELPPRDGDVGACAPQPRRGGEAARHDRIRLVDPAGAVERGAVLPERVDLVLAAERQAQQLLAERHALLRGEGPPGRERADQQHADEDVRVAGPSRHLHRATAVVVRDRGVEPEVALHLQAGQDPGLEGAVRVVVEMVEALAQGGDHRLVGDPERAPAPRTGTGEARRRLAHEVPAAERMGGGDGGVDTGPGALDVGQPELCGRRPAQQRVAAHRVVPPARCVRVNGLLPEGQRLVEGVPELGLAGGRGEVVEARRRGPGRGRRRPEHGEPGP